MSKRSPYAFPISFDNPLDELGKKYFPTKRLHNYLPYYWMHFRDIRLRVESVLEIGIQTDRSIRMWEEFFPHAAIYGMDIDPTCATFSGGRRTVFIGDQGNPRFLQEVIAQCGGFDVIIDDGSHLVEHQLTSFRHLFPSLSSHGIYVIEDTGACVGDIGLQTVNTLKTVIDQIMYWPHDVRPDQSPEMSQFPESAPWLARNAIGIAFYRWIVFLMRGNNPQDNPYLMPPARGYFEGA